MTDSHHRCVTVIGRMLIRYDTWGNLFYLRYTTINHYLRKISEDQLKMETNILYASMQNSVHLFFIYNQELIQSIHKTTVQ